MQVIHQPNQRVAPEQVSVGNKLGIGPSLGLHLAKRVRVVVGRIQAVSTAALDQGQQLPFPLRVEPCWTELAPPVELGKQLVGGDQFALHAQFPSGRQQLYSHLQCSRDRLLRTGIANRRK